MKDFDKLPIINGIFFTLVGLVLFFNPESVVKFISYCIGGLLVGLGIYKSLNYYIQDKKNGIVNRNEMAFGISSIVLGVLFIFLAGAIEMVLRFIIGGWIILAGIRRISDSFFTTDRTAKFYSLIVVGFLLVGLGIYIILVSNLAFSVVGLFMTIYGIIELVSFFFYKDLDVKKIKGKNQVKEAEVEEKE